MMSMQPRKWKALSPASPEMNSAGSFQASKKPSESFDFGRLLSLKSSAEDFQAQGMNH